MRILIIIPAHNEAEYLQKTLLSLQQQTLSAKKIIVVNDNSSDGTENIIDDFVERNTYFKKINLKSKDAHMPGTKVINAFYAGLAGEDLTQYDVVCKFDADIIFPENYLEQIADAYQKNKKLGMCSGLCYIKNSYEEWVYETIADKKHVRGPIKSYTVECFKKIGGLKKSIGWDTVDELLAQYNGYQIKTIASLHVKHLRPTGGSYNKKAIKMQGEAMYKMRYGFILTCIASLKMALQKRSIRAFLNNISGFLEHYKKKTPFMVTPQEGAFIRKYRYQGILKKILPF
ncbi:glycosyltransferase [Neptunitalea lumnitzerae]|uniref:Glycosyl transferase family 2 n=1 Tax=Neptunitalea lumnitzerae TaxID=2965509 RepID=A0ABQ5MHA5_9FLAO|nr:glycosyltransferase family 2 protein [Neptunitalea sp. Y10]GLB48795.1 glycosyl transferase family 2 [Neptunitalea sp. Y10]